MGIEFTKEELANEEWRDIVDFEGLYQVSNLGNVKSFHEKGKKGGNRAFRKDKDGYSVLFLHKNGKLYIKKVHRLVAIAFMPNPHNKPCIDHINTNKNDNRVQNLRWCTIKENAENPLSRAHISKARLGTKASEETRKKFSLQRRGHLNSMYGKNHTIETKKKMSIPVLQFDMQGNLINEFYGAADASQKTGIHRQTIVGVLKGRGKTAGGYIWKYKDSDE